MRPRSPQQLGDSVRPQVVGGKVEARLGDVPRHVLAHMSQSDKPDLHRATSLGLGHFSYVTTPGAYAHPGSPEPARVTDPELVV